MDPRSLFVSLWVKLFFVLTPFFALTMFLSLTENHTAAQRRRIAMSVSAAVALICLLLFFAGRQIFSVFGITLDSFRIGAGILLLLSGIGLVQGRASVTASVEGDVAVVPLAIPVIVGPATTGTILVMGAELTTLSAKITGCLALFAAVASVAAVLLSGAFIQRVLGARGVAILSRLTGLILSAIAAQMIMTGAQAFLPLYNQPPGDSAPLKNLIYTIDIFFNLYTIRCRVGIDGSWSCHRKPTNGNG